MKLTIHLLLCIIAASCDDGTSSKSTTADDSRNVGEGSNKINSDVTPFLRVDNSADKDDYARQAGDDTNAVWEGGPLTSEHRASVAKVRRLIILADEHIKLGKYDLAQGFYEQALEEDSYSKAAKIGLDRLSSIGQVEPLNANKPAHTTPDPH